MKKAFLLICLIATVLTCLTSCAPKDYNKELAGNWSFSCSEWQEGQKVNSVEGMIAFDENYSYHATFRYSGGVTVNIDGEWCVLDEKHALLKFSDNSVETQSKSKKTRQHFNDKFGMTDHLMCISEFSDDKFEAIYSPMLELSSSLDKSTITFNRLPSNDDLVGEWRGHVLIDGVDADCFLTLENGGKFRHSLYSTIDLKQPDGTTVMVSVDGSQSGTWKVVGDMIYLNTSSGDAKVSRASVFPSDGSHYDADADYLKQLNDEVSGSMSAAMKESMVGKIESFQSISFALKSDGRSRFSYTRKDE